MADPRKRKRDEDTTEEEKKLLELRQQIIDEDIKKLLETPYGKRILWLFLEWSGMFQDPMTGNSWTFYKIGEQNLGRKIFTALLRVDEDSLSKIRKSYNEMNEKLRRNLNG